MQKVFSYLMLGSLIFLFGCTSNVAKLPHLDSNQQLASDHSILIVKLDNFDYLDLKKVDPADAENPNARVVQYRVFKPSKMFVDTYAKAVYNIEPGTYYISFVAIDSPEGVYYSDAPGVDAQGAIAYGAFNIKAGEVLYLGDVDCRWQSTNKIKKLSLVNKLPEVKRDLNSAGRADLASKIAPAKFYARGSNINSIQ